VCNGQFEDPSLWIVQSNAEDDFHDFETSVMIAGLALIGAFFAVAFAIYLGVKLCNRYASSTRKILGPRPRRSRTEPDVEMRK